MRNVTSIKKKKTMQQYRDIVALCDTYISMLPDAKEYERIYDTRHALFMIEKIVEILNYRFLRQLQDICYDEELAKYLEKEEYLYLDDNCRDFFEKCEYTSAYGLFENGDNFMYFSDYSTRGLGRGEDERLFSFYKEYINVFSQYALEDEHLTEKDIQDEKKFFQTFFPEIYEKDIDFITYAYKVISKMQGACSEATDINYIIQCHDKLFQFQKWLKEDATRKEFDECKKLINLIELLKSPYVNCFYGTEVHYIETMECCYICIRGGYSDYDGEMIDGKCFFPSYFFVKIATEQLLHLIEELYY